MSHSAKTYARPNDLPSDLKKKIETMFGDRVFIFWNEEEIMFNSAPVPMEKLGKFIGLLNNNCITTRKK